MGLKTSGETMQSLNNSSRRCVHVNAIFSPPGCALPKWGVGREAIVFTTRYVMQQGAKAGQTVGIDTIEIIAGNFSEGFLNQFFPIRRVEFFFFCLAIFIRNTCWSYLHLIGFALVMEFSCDHWQIDIIYAYFR